MKPLISVSACIFSNLLLMLCFVILFAFKKTYETFETKHALYSMLTPLNCANAEGKQRVGRFGDGGYIIPRKLPPMSGLLSYGVGDDISFENEFVKKFNVNAYLYDHTVNLQPQNDPRIHFTKEGLSDKKRPMLDTLESHLNKCGLLHDHSWIFLKMDIEGAEWPGLQVVSDSTWKRICVIAIEFHYLNVVNDEKLRLFRKLKQHFHVFHVHANNCCGTFNHGGHDLPVIIEVTLVNKILYNCNDPFTGDLPSELDRPNVGGSEIPLSYWK